MKTISHPVIQLEKHTVFRHMGTVSVLVQLNIIAFVAKRTGFNWLGGQPISDLGTTVLACLYTAGFVIGGACLWMFMNYMTTAYHTSKWFPRVFGAGILAEVITGVIPDKNTASSVMFSNLWQIHWVAAVVLILAMPLAMIIYLSTKNLNGYVQMVTRRLFWLYIITLLPEMILISTHTLYAVSELTSLLIFDAWVLFMSNAPHIPRVVQTEPTQLPS